MRDSSQKDLAVFDFSEEEAAVEEASARLQSRLRHRMEGAVNKYHFLEAYASGLTLKHDVSGILCIDTDERENASGPYTMDVSERDQALSYEKGELEETMASSTTFVEHNQGQAVDVVSEDEENWSMRTVSQSSTSTDTADEEGCLDCPEIENCYAESGDELDNQMEVIISSEYFIHGSTLYGESQLAFSVDSVKIECSDASGSVEQFATQWAVADLVYIDCRWSESVASALVKLCFRANDATKRQKDSNDFDVFGVMFSVSDVRWPDIEKSIRNLAPIYNDIWNINSGDMIWEGDSVGPHAFLSGGNVPEIADFFEDVIYPKGDPDAVSISKRDFDLLQPETFINDTIIDFYIKYLKDNIHPDQKHRFHFFNSFFFRKLADLDKDRGSVSEGRAAFLRVRKWTRKVNIFEKDYIFIPVNFNLHWSLLVICHPGEVTNMTDDIIDSDKVPCILHMDSIKGSHTGLKNIIQSYIWEEWKERHPQVTADDSSKFLNLRFVSLELPQQENSFDCGLFLLHYVELFLEEAPMTFDPFKITKFSSFLSADWFPPSEASIKRSVIRKLIYNLLNDSCKKTSPSTCSNGHPSTSVYPENGIEQVQHIELLSAHCSPAKNVMGDTLCPDTEDGIELLRSSSSAHFDKEGLIPPEFLEQTVHSMSLPENGEDVHMHNVTSSKLLFSSCPTEELAGESGHLSLSMEKEVCRSLDGKLDTQFCATSSPDVVRTLVTPWDTEEEKDADVELASECTDAYGINVNEGGDIEKMTSPDNFCYVPETPTTCSREKVDDYVEDSQEAGTSEAESNDCEDSGTICATEAECKIVDGREINTNACEVDDVCEVPNATRTENGDGVELATNENAGDDHQEASSGAIRQDDNGRAICCGEVTSGDTICQVNTTASFEGIIVADEDNNALDAVQVVNKRLQPNKRRKIMTPEGTRMRTRSLTRECHNDM